VSENQARIAPEAKYAPPYPQSFYAFWPRHALRAGSIVAVMLFVLLAVVALFRVPIDPTMPPLPDEGMWVPAPEWYLMFVFQPFWLLAGERAAWQPLGTFWVPLFVIALLLAVPFLFRRKAGVRAQRSKAEKMPLLLLAAGIWLIGTGAVVGSGGPAKTLGCPSCHNATMGERQALPPADAVAYLRESRRHQIEVGHYNVGSEGHTGAEGGSYKDANWQLRHFYEPTMTW